MLEVYHCELICCTPGGAAFTGLTWLPEQVHMNFCSKKNGIFCSSVCKELGEYLRKESRQSLNERTIRWIPFHPSSQIGFALPCGRCLQRSSALRMRKPGWQRGFESIWTKTKCKQMTLGSLRVPSSRIAEASVPQHFAFSRFALAY